MKLTKAQLRGYGLAIDGAIMDDTLDTAIEVAEMSVVKEAVGNDNYMDILSWGDTDTRLIGGTCTHDSEVDYVRGYLRSASYIAFACLLLLNDAQATAMGTTVQKNSEYSMHVEGEKHARRWFAEGLKGLQELCRVCGWEYKTPELPSAVM